MCKAEHKAKTQRRIKHGPNLRSSKMCSIVIVPKLNTLPKSCIFFAKMPSESK